MGIITIAITFYEHKKIEIENWRKILHEITNDKEISDDVKVLILNDNPEKTLKNIFSSSDKVEFYEPVENVGKYKLVKDACKNGFVNTKWIKICDPDDIIHIPTLKNTVNFLKTVKIDCSLFSDTANLVSEKELNYDNVEMHLKSSTIVPRKWLSTDNSILLSKDLANSDFDLKNQNKSSDALLALSSLKILDRKILILDNNFYIYNKNNGISNDSASNFSLKLVNEFLTYLKIFSETEYNYFQVPSNWDYKWIHNYLISTNAEINYAVEVLEQTMNLLNKIYTNNNIDCSISKEKFSENIKKYYEKNKI